MVERKNPKPTRNFLLLRAGRTAGKVKVENEADYLPTVTNVTVN